MMENILVSKDHFCTLRVAVGHASAGALNPLMN